VVSLLWGPTGLRGFASKLGQALLSGLAGMPAGKGTKLSLRDMPNARAARDTQAILSADIDWNAPELQNLSASARDFLERLLQVGVGVLLWGCCCGVVEEASGRVSLERSGMQQGPVLCVGSHAEFDVSTAPLMAVP
jgi:hypothetical protein